MKKGDVVLIDFPFTDLSGNKLRPALILAKDGDNVVLAFFTTTLKEVYKSDLLIIKSDTNGLKRDSILRLNKLTTLSSTLIKGKFGNISDSEINEINKKLIELFDLE